VLARSAAPPAAAEEEGEEEEPRFIEINQAVAITIVFS
jgi:hypothetical protein